MNERNLTSLDAYPNPGAFISLQECAKNETYNKLYEHIEKLIKVKETYREALTEERQRREQKGRRLTELRDQPRRDGALAHEAFEPQRERLLELAWQIHTEHQADPARHTKLSQKLLIRRFEHEFQDLPADERYSEHTIKKWHTAVRRALQENPANKDEFRSRVIELKGQQNLRPEDRPLGLASQHLQPRVLGH